MVQVLNFVPMTGRGAFDCTYDPNMGTLDVLVKIYADYENRPSEGVIWTELAKSKFQIAAGASVDRNWNGKLRFVNRHLNPVARAVPNFGVKFVPQREATVLMKVPRYASAYGPGNLARCDSWVGLEQVNTGLIKAQATAMMHSETTTPINVKLTEAQPVSRDERRRVEELVASLGLDNIALTVDGGVTPQVRVNLAKFVTKLKLGPQSRPLIPIIVDLRYNKEAGAVVKSAVAQGREVLKLLKLYNVPNPVEFRFLNEMSRGDAGRIAINPDLSFETTFDADMWMDIFAHEYGHMLGLPDEYDALPLQNSNVPKDIAINRFMAMTDLYGMMKPQMGRMTTSLMCKGRDVLPCHMITVLQALRRLTQDEHWKVE
jgi:hypothetical protein